MVVLTHVQDAGDGLDGGGCDHRYVALTVMPKITDSRANLGEQSEYKTSEKMIDCLQCD